ISAPGLAANPEKVAGLYFNLDSALDPTQLLFSSSTKTGQFDDPVISLGVDSFKADGDGFFDILFDFDKDGWKRAFNGGDVLEYTITLASLTADSFRFLSSPDGDPGEYIVAAHLLSLGAAGDSAWISTIGVDPIPEPATLFLLGFGSIVLMRKKRH
ncbi:MAG: PEP-CTERM sorting domain-containing protein, partial [Planctomycetota bacterium]